MTRLFILNISILIKHSAQENDNAAFGLFFPLIILIFWIILGNPMKRFRGEPKNYNPYSAIKSNAILFCFYFVMLNNNRRYL